MLSRHKSTREKAPGRRRRAVYLLMKENKSEGYLKAGLLKLSRYHFRKAVLLLEKAVTLGNGLAALYLATIAREFTPNTELTLEYLTEAEKTLGKSYVDIHRTILSAYSGLETSTRFPIGKPALYKHGWDETIKVLNKGAPNLFPDIVNTFIRETGNIPHFHNFLKRHCWKLIEGLVELLYNKRRGLD